MQFRVREIGGSPLVALVALVYIDTSVTQLVTHTVAANVLKHRTMRTFAHAQDAPPDLSIDTKCHIHPNLAE